MTRSREELIREIEVARKNLDKSIDENARYEEIYKKSMQVDGLIEQYIAAGY